MTATINSDIYFKNGHIPYEGKIVKETEKAFQIDFALNSGDKHERRHLTWIPKSVIEIKKFDSCNAEYISVKNWFVKNILKSK